MRRRAVHEEMNMTTRQRLSPRREVSSHEAQTLSL